MLRMALYLYYSKTQKARSMVDKLLATPRVNRCRQVMVRLEDSPMPRLGELSMVEKKRLKDHREAGMKVLLEMRL